jgi:diguanylate cyclase (GGDEF)-like protein
MVEHGLNERQRLATLAALDLLDTDPEPDFDRIVGLARATSGCPMAVISLIDADRQWFKARCGIDAAGTPREQAFCAHAIQRSEMMVVPDATLDPRFADNPLVTGAPHVRFYAGVPLFGGLPGGERVALGTLCVIDDRPHAFDAARAEALTNLARLAEALIEARTLAIRAAQLAEERRLHLEKMARQDRQFRQAERIADIGSWHMTLADGALTWSDQTFAIHEIPIGQQPAVDAALDFYPPDARERITAALERTVATGVPFDVESDFVTARGTRRRVRSMGELETRNGLPYAVIGVFQDVTADYEIEQALRRSASTDDLTGLANRGRLHQVLDAAIADARETENPLALLMIDLDGFKALNDNCGHAAGDAMLQLMARRLQAPHLAGCFPARLGGDEFVLVVPGRDTAALDRLLRRLLVELRHVHVGDGHYMPISGTIGAAWLDGSVLGRIDLLHRADIALYEAKRTKRGTARIHDGATGIDAPGEARRAA